MRALIPPIDIPVLEIGPVVIDSWSFLVMTSFVVGLELARARGIKHGLQVREIVDGVCWTVGGGFIVGHLVHVLAYNQWMIEEQGWIVLLKVWAGLSSTGGFLGAVIGSILYYKVLRKKSWAVHADTIAWAFPFSWTIARIGCFSVHDHKGISSDFWLAVDFPLPLGPRHDLALYEVIWTGLIALAFYWMRNRSVRPGFFLVLFITMYAPIRFFFDFLRNPDLKGADVRYVGLTPAQWILAVLFSVGLYAALEMRDNPVERVSEE